MDCNLKNKSNYDFLYPVVFNSIIEHNLMISKFSPQTGATHFPAIYIFNNNDVFVQVRKRDSIAWLISLEIRGGGQFNKRAGRNTLPLMFLGIIAVLINPVDSTGDTLSYDCSNPTDIKVCVAEARCQSNPELPGEKTTVKVVQLVENKELKGFKCRVTSHGKSYYLGLFSYNKPILSAEQEETIMVSASTTCGEMIGTRRFVTLQTRKSETIAVPIRTNVMKFEVGYQTVLNSIIKCQGESVLMNSSIQKE